MKRPFSRGFQAQTSRTCLLAFLAFALVATSSYASEARARQGFIVIRGHNNAYIDVTLTKPIRFPKNRLCVDCSFEGGTNGAFVGYAIHRLPDYKLIAGAVWARALDPGASDVRFIPRMGRVDRLRPGKYRFTLLSPPRTDSWGKVEASVLIPTQDSTSMILEPTKKAAVDILLQRNASVVPGQPVNVLRGDVRVKKTTTVMLAASVDADYTQVAHASACLLPRESDSLCEVEDEKSSSQSVNPGGGGAYLGAVRVYRAGKLPPGRYEAAFNMAVAGFGKSMGALVLAIH